MLADGLTNDTSISRSCACGVCAIMSAAVTAATVGECERDGAKSAGGDGWYFLRSPSVMMVCAYVALVKSFGFHAWTVASVEDDITALRREACYVDRRGRPGCQFTRI
ncbi:hypothetical protein BC832DRAFT_546934 [Gaertneriomyces semiglobifer]|nr:hypothetical protein BC832DRAFT_546934 [Gaertneriomyces semiglobifer]